MQIHEVVRQLHIKMDEIIGRQERTLSLVSAVHSGISQFWCFLSLTDYLQDPMTTHDYRVISQQRRKRRGLAGIEKKMEIVEEISVLNSYDQLL